MACSIILSSGSMSRDRYRNQIFALGVMQGDALTEQTVRSMLCDLTLPKGMKNIINAVSNHVCRLQIFERKYVKTLQSKMKNITPSLWWHQTWTTKDMAVNCSSENLTMAKSWLKERLNSLKTFAGSGSEDALKTRHIHTLLFANLVRLIQWKGDVQVAHDFLLPRSQLSKPRIVLLLHASEAFQHLGSTDLSNAGKTARRILCATHEETKCLND